MAGCSIVEYFGEQGGNRCGYCGNSSSSQSHGMWAHKMTCQDYQDLIDRGWRRSGKYVYKPQLNKTCCPQYPIRCDALQFKISKSQKKVLKKMTKFLAVPKTVDTDKVNQKTSEDSSESREGCDEEVSRLCSSHLETATCSEDLTDITTGLSLTVNTHQQVNKNKTAEVCKQVCNQNGPAPGAGPDPDRPRCRKAKQIRLDRKQQKLANRQGVTSAVSDRKPSVQESRGPAAKTIEDFIVDCLPNKDSAHKLEIKLVQSDLDVREFSDSFAESATVFFKYQREIHKDPPEKCTKKRVNLVHVDMDSAEFREYFTESHKVFAKYQIAIHKDSKDDCGIGQYQRFLVDSPLVRSKSPGAPPEGYGSFHQQYYLDGRRSLGPRVFPWQHDKLIAVGVLDILPNCVSSVYFFYDPDYSFLSFGVYSALRELHFTRALHQQSPSLKYYYMGFYIHSCPKMSYKSQYCPSYIVCPETYQWVSIEKSRPKLDASKYSRLNESPEDPPKTDVESVMVLFKRQAMPYQIFKVMKGFEGNHGNDEEVEEYANFVGPLVAPRMLLYRSS